MSGRKGIEGTLKNSTLLLKSYNKKQETEECNLKLCGCMYRHGTYTPQGGTILSPAFFLFTRVSSKSRHATNITTGI